MYIEDGSSFRIGKGKTRSDYYHHYAIDIPHAMYNELACAANDVHKPISVITRSAIRQWLDRYRKENFLDSLLDG